MSKLKQLNLFYSDSIFETNELLTKREMIEEIVNTVEDQLWSSDDELILETAKLVGLDIVAHTDEFGLFWKKA